MFILARTNCVLFRSQGEIIIDSKKSHIFLGLTPALNFQKNNFVRRSIFDIINIQSIQLRSFRLQTGKLWCIDTRLFRFLFLRVSRFDRSINVMCAAFFWSWAAFPFVCCCIWSHYDRLVNFGIITEIECAQLSKYFEIIIVIGFVDENTPKKTNDEQ